MPSASHPYTALTPDKVLDAVESLGYVTDARIFALNSYENRVYQVGLESGDYLIVKFYRPGRWSDAQILEEHNFSWELADLEIPVAAPLRFTGDASLLNFDDFRFAVFPRIKGREPEFDNADNLVVMGRFIGRIHLAGASSSFATRKRLSVEDFAVNSREFLLSNNFIPKELLVAYESLSRDLVERVKSVMHGCGERGYQRIHGDCHLGNVLWADGIPTFVDFDDTLTGPRIQDLWMLLSGDRNQKLAQLMEIVDGYNEFNSFDAGELELIESLRTLRLMNYSAWLARRWDDPAFPRNFPWFNTVRYWSEHILELREQMAALDEAPLQVY